MADVDGEARQRKEDLRSILSTAAGRRVLYRLIVEAGAFAPSFTVEPLVTAFNEGRRKGGLSLLEEVQTASREAYLLMLSERLEVLPTTPVESQPGEFEDFLTEE